MLDDYDDFTETGYSPEHFDDEREEAPLFGCACENPLSVDTVCRSCMEAMGYVPLTDGGGYRKMRRRRFGYAGYPSRRERARRLAADAQLVKELRALTGDLPF